MNHFGARFGCNCSRSIGAVIIHYYDAPGAERRYGRANNGLFIARRNDDADDFAVATGAAAWPER